MQHVSPCSRSYITASTKRYLNYLFWCLCIGLMVTLSGCATNKVPEVVDTDKVQIAAIADRAEMMARAEEWQGVVLFRNPYGYSVKFNKWGYRQDCSGYLSYIWGLGEPNQSVTQPITSSFSNYSYKISAEELQPGDALNKPDSNPGDDNFDGHIVLFGGWVDQNAGTFTVYEVTGKATTDPNAYPNDGAQKSTKNINKYLQEGYHPIRSDAFRNESPPPPSDPITLSNRTFVNLGGNWIESITAYGKYWNFDAAGNALNGNNGSPLSSVDRYAGPCYGSTSCDFDTRTFFYTPDGPVESITVGDNYWNFLGDAPWDKAPSGTLSGVGRYASGPCSLGGSCHFDTRAFVPAEVFGQQLESITVGGYFWNFDATGQPLLSGNLSDEPKYASGPCASAPYGQCAFETRTFVNVNGEWIESITAYGQYWNYRMDNTPWPVAYHGDLREIARYQGIRP
jgi:hypothetical protein